MTIPIRGVATKFCLGGGDGFIGTQTYLTTSKIEFLLGFRSLYFENGGKKTKLSYV